MVTKNQNTMPDDRGRFGDFGGKFVPETLMAALDQLEAAYWEVKEDKDFQDKLAHLLRTYAGRPTALRAAVITYAKASTRRRPNRICFSAEKHGACRKSNGNIHDDGWMDYLGPCK